MAVPKGKVSKARRDKRRSSVWKLKVPGLSEKRRLTPPLLRFFRTIHKLFCNSHGLILSGCEKS